MPKGLKETSSIIQIGATAVESAPGVFTAARVDLQLNPLDNEVFVVYAIDMDGKTPELIPATRTETKLSVSSTLRTSVGSIADSNVLAQLQTVVEEAGGAAVLNAKHAGETPATVLEYIAIIATNDFFVNIQGVNNVATTSGNVRLYGARARADSSIYAALVQSELLSAWGEHLALSDELAAAVLAGFKQGVIAEAKRQSVMVGKEVVRELPGALTDTGALVSSALMFVEETAEVAAKPKKRSRSARAADKKLSLAFKQANNRYRLKNGQLRKGRTQADIARLAHKLRKKMWARMGIPHPSHKTNELLLKILKELRLLRKDLKK